MLIASYGGKEEVRSINSGVYFFAKIFRSSYPGTMGEKRFVLRRERRYKLALSVFNNGVLDNPRNANNNKSEIAAMRDLESEMFADYYYYIDEIV